MLDKIEKIGFSPFISRPVMILSNSLNQTALLFLEIGRNLTYIAPAVVVAVSCVVSAVQLGRGNVGRQREIQVQRHKATITIILFALLYGVCNVPLVVELVLGTYSRHTDNTTWYRDLFTFDTQSYYYNAVNTIFLAANSAVNPVFYLWRMPRMRECIVDEIRIKFRLNQQSISRPNNCSVGENGERAANRNVETNNVTADQVVIPVISLETRI